MGTPEILDFERLLTPIPGENPAGRPLRADFSPTAVYRAIKDARSEARAGERSAAWGEDRETQSADPWTAWKRLLELAPKAIAEESKDIEVAAWLSEGLVREHGYAGLRDGFRLMSQLVESFWDTLYPLPDEDGLATRLAPVAGLNGEESDGVLIAPILNIPITAADSSPPLSLADYRRAVDLDQVTDPAKRTQRIEQGTVTLQVFERAVRETPREFYDHLQEDMRECSEAFEKLCAVLEEKCGKDAGGYPRPLLPRRSAARWRPAATRCAGLSGAFSAPAARRRPRTATERPWFLARARWTGRRPGCGRGKTPSERCCRWPTTSSAPSRIRRSPTHWSRRCVGAGCRCPNC